MRFIAQYSIRIFTLNDWLHIATFINRLVIDETCQLFTYIVLPLTEIKWERKNEKITDKKKFAFSCDVNHRYLHITCSRYNSTVTIDY